jgi:hypothetical protein
MPEFLTRRRWVRRFFAAACGLLALRNIALAQPVRVTVTGRTIDEGRAPLGRVHITAVGSFIETESDPRGIFRLQLPRGEWTVRARLFGYLPATARVTIGSKMPDTVTIILPRSLNELRAITTTADATPPMAVSATAENVRQLPALGEPDLLRVLPFLPGVHQTNDVRSTLYLAGSASDEVAMRLDGFRLQWPTHLNGIFGAIDVDALDHADVMIHHVPASVDGAVGGVVDFWPRLAGSRPAFDAGVSLLSASATTVTETPIENVQVLASGRASYAEQAVSHIFGRAHASQSDALPSSFQDWIARIATNSHEHFAGGLLSYGTRDERPRTASNGTPLSWGETLIGMHGAWFQSIWRVEGQASSDQASLTFRESSDAARGIDMLHRWSSAMVQLRRDGEVNRSSVGVAADTRHNADQWNSSTASGTIAPIVPFDYDSTTSQHLVAVFAETEFRKHVGALNVGVRATELAGGTYVAPRLLVTHDVSTAWTFTAALERRHQFDAQLAPFGGAQVTQPAFLLNRARSVDAGAVSAVWHAAQERDNARRLELTAYVRRFPDRPLLQTPSVADTIDPTFPAFRRVAGKARGLSAGGLFTSTRNLVLQGSYTYQQAETRSGPAWIPADWDIRHSFAMFGSVPILAGWTLTTSGQLRSGFPITPVEFRLLVPQIGSNSFTTRYSYDSPNSARIPGFRRFDVGVQRSWHALNGEWTFSSQIVNVLARNNPISYDWRVYFDEVGVSGNPQTSNSGLPLVPSVGVSVRW